MRREHMTPSQDAEAMQPTRRNPLWAEEQQRMMQRISRTGNRGWSVASSRASARGRSVGELVMRLVDGLTVLVFMVMGVVVLWEVMS